MENVISAILLITGLINLFPLIAVLVSSKLYFLYAVTIDDLNLLSRWA